MYEHEAATLLADESFINYCLGRNSNDIAQWSAFLDAHPHIQQNIEEVKAVVLLTSCAVKNTEIQQQLSKLKQRIKYRETTSWYRATIQAHNFSSKNIQYTASSRNEAEC